MEEMEKNATLTIGLWEKYGYGPSDVTTDGSTVLDKFGFAVDRSRRCTATS